MQIKSRSGRWLVWVSYHKLHGPVEYKQHTHAFLELSCVVRGSGTYRVNGEAYDMRPGDVFLFSPTDSHHLELHNEDLEHIVIHLDPAFLWNALGNDMDYKFLMVFFQRNANFRCRLERENEALPMISQWFREIWQESQEQQECYELMIKIKLQSILAQIIRSYDCIDQSKAARAPQSGDLESMNRVLAYIDDHLDSEIRLADLAAIAHVSTSYFSAIFKQYNGLPPVEYVVGQRIRRAIEYIRTTDMSLAEIATACGFNNSTNFYKAFRRATGRTPASYRTGMAYDDTPYAMDPVAVSRQEFAATPASRESTPPPTPIYTPTYTTSYDPCNPCDPCGGATTEPCDPCDPCADPCQLW